MNAELLGDLRESMGTPALRLACHAALPVVIDAGLLNLLRVNFFLDDPPDVLPFEIEAELLLSPLFREAGEGLYEIDPNLRDQLLVDLYRDFGPERVRRVAVLLEQYADTSQAWRSRPTLDAAQRLTALAVLDPDAARVWLEARSRSGEPGAAFGEAWQVAMSRRMARQQGAASAEYQEAAGIAYLAERVAPNLAQLASWQGTVSDTSLRVDGPCPVCQHDAPNVVPWRVPATASPDLLAGAGPTAPVSVVLGCTCQQPHAGRPGTVPAGCGRSWVALVTVEAGAVTLQPVSPDSAEVASLEMARQELLYLLRREPAGQDLIGLLAAARGGLSAADLAELTGTARPEVEQILDPPVRGQILLLRAINRTSATTSPPVYLFAHESLLDTATDYLGARLPDYRSRLHAWAGAYRAKGWPPDTPEYLISGYFQLLTALGDLPEMLNLVLDPARQDRILRTTGNEEIALREVITTAGYALRSGELDRAMAARLASLLSSIERRSASSGPAASVALAIAWATLGGADRAETVARSISDPDLRDQAMMGIVRAIAGEDPLRAGVIARSITAEDQRAQVMAELARADLEPLGSDSGTVQEQSGEPVSPEDESPPSSRPSPPRASRTGITQAGDTGLDDRGPVFFLSYANVATGKRSSSGFRNNSENATSRLFVDLSENIGQLISLPTGANYGFMDAGLKGGVRWQSELMNALDTCQVLVALLSEPYLASDWCGKEWGAFSKRTVRQLPGAPGPQPRTSIIPVLWAPISSRSLPPAVRDQVLFVPEPKPDPDLPELYREVGIYGMLRMGREDSYQIVVWQLSMLISRIYHSQRLESGTFTPGELVNVFRSDFS